MAISKFQVDNKVGMINLWRDRCDKLGKVPGGTAVESNHCTPCDELAQEICNELREVLKLRTENEALLRQMKCQETQ